MPDTHPNNTKGRHEQPPYLCPDGSNPCGRYGYCSYCPHEKKPKDKDGTK